MHQMALQQKAMTADTCTLNIFGFVDQENQFENFSRDLWLNLDGHLSS